MPEAAGWQFAVEVHPAGWRFPAGASWVAGWIYAGEERVATDIRAWVDRRPFLGLAGLPRRELEQKLLGRAGPPHAGFVLQLTPHRGATRLRLEVRDPAGAWTEFFRTTITAESAEAAPKPAPLAPRLAAMTLAVLRLHRRQPRTSFAALADEVVGAAVAVPLNSLPNPPLVGALEEPVDTGRLLYGRLAVTGWLAHRTERIRRISAVADGFQESALLHGLARSDVDHLFTGLPGSEQAQFIGQADAPADPGTPALLKVFAELENGEKHLAFAQRFVPQVTAGEIPPLPRLSRLTFARALWALRGAARRHEMPPGPRAALMSAVAEAWTQYRAAAPRPISRRPPPAAPAATARPQRFLVVTHNLNFEGAPRLIFELARHLHGQPGNRVQVLSPQDGPLRRLFEEAGMPVQVVDLAPALAATSPAEFSAALAAVTIDWSQVDLVIANTMVSFWGVHLARAARKPSVLYVHESAPVRQFFAARVDPALLPVIEDAFRRATRVAFTADASRQIFAHLEEGDNFRVLPSWLDVAAIDAFVAAHPKAELRGRHHLPADAVVCLNLGTVCERKGQHVFLRAIARLAPQLRAAARPVEFVMVGARDDSFLAMLRQQVADAGLDHVRFVLETRDNLAWHRLADLLVCTSFEESSPRVLLEAAAFGTPIVSTDVNGIPELVTPDEAWLVPPGDPRRLAEALQAALAAHLAGDTTRPRRARHAVTARFDERVSLPQHAALANEAAAIYA